jgi:hypothetical protein
MEGHEFLTAHFCNNERTTIEVYWATEDETRVTYVEAKEGDPQYEEVLSYLSIDQLHENTYKHIREQNEQFENQVMEIAKKRGMIIDIDDLNSDAYGFITKFLFAEFNPETEKEKLFLYKIRLFELDHIKNSNNKAAKKELRQAKTMIEATRVACNIALESSED